MLKGALFYGLISFVFTSGLVYVFIRLMRRVNLFQPIRELGPESHKVFKQHTITMGGVPMFVGLYVTCVLSGVLRYDYVSIIMFISFLCMLLGLVDDLSKVVWESYRGMPARYKLLLQLVITAIFWWLLRDSFDGDRFSNNLFLMFLVLAGSMNAVNLADGLDGLAGGMMFFVIAGLALIAWLEGLPNLMVFLFIVAGAILGFLCFNIHPALIFMGDAGSMLLGGIMGTTAVTLHKEVLLVLMAGLFVWETLSVIIQVVSFKLTGKRVFKMSPFHHHLELAGWKEESIVYTFWGISAVLVFASLCLA